MNLMERIEVLRRSSLGLGRLESMNIEGLFVKEEEKDMRRYITMFKQKDFKLRRFFDVFSKGLSFGNTEYFFKDGRSIF
jgi:hypothetical protein